MISQNQILKYCSTYNLRILSYSLFLCSLFFPLRKVFFTNSAYLTGAYSDFTSFSLYLSDILLFMTFVGILISRGGARELAHHVVKNLKWLIFWLILGFLWHFKSNNSLNWYFLLKYAELIVAYGTTVYLLKNFPIKTIFLKIFVVFGIWQSLLAIFQFQFQRSLNFGWLGENLLNISILGMAKIVSGGTTYIRGYGTFPHPNLLSAFLIVSIFFSLFLIHLSKTTKPRIFYSILLLINILGLTVTFSRGAFLALGIGLIVLFGTLFLLNFKMKRSLAPLGMTTAVLIVSIFSAIITFHPFLLTRATITDQATLDRKEYNRIGIKLIKDKPLFGTGIGESVLHMEQYSGKKLETWEKQPIHNFFLLSAAELGIPGALILIWIFLSHLWKLFENCKLPVLRSLGKGKKIENSNPTCYLLLATFSSFLVLMLFDHYFYTLQQTQLLLWVLLGIIASEAKLNENISKI